MKSARPRVAATACIGVTAMVLAACGGGGGEEATSGSGTSWFKDKPVVGEVVKDSLKGKQVVFAGNGGIMEEAQKVSVAAPFTAQSGAKVVFDLADENKMRAMVDANNVQWDVVNAGWTTAVTGCGKYSEKLDMSKLDVSKIPADLGLTGECFVPAVLYGDILVYNTKKYGSNPPTSWADFFDTAKFPGKRAVNTQPIADVNFLSVAELAAGKTPQQVNTEPMDLDSVFGMLDKLKGNIVPWETGAQIQQMLTSGQVDMAWVWSGRAYGAQKAGGAIAPVWNQPVLAFDPLVIVKGTKNLDAAYAFVNFYLGAEPQAGVSEATSYTPLNVDSKVKDDELLELYRITPERQKGGVVSNVKWYIDHLSEVNDRWAKWVSGV